jgi:hypothetical protein
MATRRTALSKEGLGCEGTVTLPLGRGCIATLAASSFLRVLTEASLLLILETYPTSGRDHLSQITPLLVIDNPEEKLKGQTQIEGQD